MEPITPHKILAICFDCGDTIVDEDTEVKSSEGVTQEASLIPGAEDTLRALKGLGYRLALVADGPAGTFYNVLGHYGLLDLFDSLAISALVGAEKPDPLIFRYALNQLEIPLAEYGRVLMVGNHLARDIKGANALGLVSIWLDWSPRRPKVPADPLERPCYTIKKPSDLMNIVERLEKNGL
ncbi:MAG: HAD family hydrolase [Chloroflexi bacterium]|nr:MAG: HAD family hydrolase [Chloroflexota bacterium]